MIFEERRTVVRRGQLENYQAALRGEIWPAAKSAGGKVLCLLGGVIGVPADELLQVTAYSELEAWQLAQEKSPKVSPAVIESDEARLLRPISPRPKDPVPSEDRRAIYGYRRFIIDRDDIDEFVHCSKDGIWPRIESQGACILGLWATVASTTPLEVVLLTGYHSPSHWEATRGTLPRPEGFDENLWAQAASLGARRNRLTLRSWVNLMRALQIE